MTFLLAAALLISSQAPSTTPPIRVTSCSVAHGQKIGAGYIRATFVNTSDLTVKRVRLDVTFNGIHRDIEDVGSFEPGVPIAHEFLANHVSQTQSHPATCTVIEADFADGTRWLPGQ